MTVGHTSSSMASMDVVEKLELAKRMVKEHGIEIREQTLGRTPSGLCRMGDKRVLFLEATLSSREQLETIVQLLRDV